MSQSKRHSILEAVSQVSFGFFTSALLWELVVKPIWNIQTSFAENMQITSLFTVVSIARSYAFRRLFNWIGQSHERNKSQ